MLRQVVYLVNTLLYRVSNLKIFFLIRVSVTKIFIAHEHVKFTACNIEHVTHVTPKHVLFYNLCVKSFTLLPTCFEYVISPSSGS
jgi:hypothetical protein